MKTKPRIAVLLSAAILCTAAICPRLGGVASQSENANAGTIACRALEVHASTQPAVTVVIFHQQNKAEQEQLATLLREHSGEVVEFQVGEGEWAEATMFQLKSCFGRGMLLLPSGAVTMEDGATFLLRIPRRNTKI